MRFLQFLMIVCFIVGCTYDNRVEDFNANESLISLNIPDDFDFSTHREVIIEIIDNTPNVSYDIFNFEEESVSRGIQTYLNQHGELITGELFYNDVLKNQLFSGVPYNGIWKTRVTIPNHINYLYLRRKDKYLYSAVKVPINGNEVVFNFQNTINDRNFQNTSSAVQDILFGVNGSAELFSIDPLTGNLTLLASMPMGSWTCAIDEQNKKLYSVGNSSPYPLMRYDIDTDTWEILANLGIPGTRFTFNDENNLLYLSNLDELYSIDPSSGQLLNTWNIEGLHSLSGGDLVFSQSGELFLCTFSGLYKLELDSNNHYQSTRISADNLPFSPTSIAFDSNQELWIGNNGTTASSSSPNKVIICHIPPGNPDNKQTLEVNINALNAHLAHGDYLGSCDGGDSSDLIVMDTQTGGWEYRFGINAGNNSDFERKINDLAMLTVNNEDYVDTDSDGDGVMDRNDSSPNDPNISFETYTPSRYGEGTVAFEDLWPSYGDYDFNDVSLSYQTILYTNSENKAIKIDFICTAKSHLSGYTNAIAFELEGLIPSQITSVSNQSLSESYLSFNTNGTEANQSTAVIFITDNAHTMPDDLTVTVVFTEPIDTNEIGTAPFNPFIVANRNRNIEIHLPNKSVTDLGTEGNNITGVNSDPDGNYIANTGLPWAISIAHDFKSPKDGISILSAYNFFEIWATSGGTESIDWYKDTEGNRNDNLLQN